MKRSLERIFRKDLAMKNNIWLIYACIVLGTSFQVSAINSYRLLKAPNGCLVLILGDIHFAEHYLSREEFIMAVQKNTLKEPLHLIVELNEHAREGKGAITVSVQTLRDTWGKKNPFVSLEYFDPRSYYSGLIEGLNLMFSHAIRTCIPSNSSLQLPIAQGLWNNYKTQLNASLEAGTISVDNSLKESFTVAGFLADIAEKSTKLDNLAEKYRSKEKLFTLFKGIAENFSEAVRKITEQFRKNLPDQSFWDAITDNFRAAETPLDLMNFYLEFRDLYCFRTDYAFFDALLIDKIVDRKDALQPLCCFVGEAHAINISELILSGTDWERISANMLGTTACPIAQPTKDFLEGLAQATHEVLIGLKEKVPKPMTLKKCAACSQVGKLLVCSRCKAVKYCSREYQSKAWGEHKKVCKKVKVKVKQ